MFKKEKRREDVVLAMTSKLRLGMMEELDRLAGTQ